MVIGEHDWHALEKYHATTFKSQMKKKALNQDHIAFVALDFQKVMLVPHRQPHHFITQDYM